MTGEVIRTQDLVTPYFAEVDKRLSNWGRWANMSETSSHCGSIESQYVPPRPGDGAGGRDDWGQCDQLDAQIIEDAVFMLHDPRNKQLLIAFYIRRVRLKNLCKRYKLSRTQLDARKYGVMGELMPHIKHVEEIRALPPKHPMVRQFSDYRRRFHAAQIALGPIDATHPACKPGFDIRIVHRV